jgi:hypothetical protein
MVNYRCINCRWFDNQHKSLLTVSKNLGYCRKHKPVIYQTEDNRYFGGWPLVDDDDFCGEFRQDGN